MFYLRIRFKYKLKQNKIMYKQAIRENYKFQTNVGALTVGQLFTASDATLGTLEENLKSEVESAKTPNRFERRKYTSKTLKNKLAIVSDVIDTIILEREEKATALSNKEELKELLAEKLRRQKDGIKDIKDADLDKKIAELKG